MKALGIIITIIGIITLISSCSMDTSVPVGLTGERVNNIGLMRDQSNYMLIGGISFIAGVILWAFGSKKSKKSSILNIENSSYTEELTKLADLRDRDAITQDEFSHRKSILDAEDKKRKDLPYKQMKGKGFVLLMIVIAILVVLVTLIITSPPPSVS